MVKEACEKTNKEAGDGTTTTAVLTYGIASEGLRYIQNGINPFALTKALHEVGKNIIKQVKDMGKCLKTKYEVRQIATISAQDEEIGKLIADIMSDIGNDGTITVEEGQTIGITKEIKKGLQYDTGFISPYMASDGGEMYTGKDVPFLVTDLKIESFNQLKPIMETLLKQEQKNLVVICDDISPEALASVVLNKVK